MTGIRAILLCFMALSPCSTFAALRKSGKEAGDYMKKATASVEEAEEVDDSNPNAVDQHRGLTLMFQNMDRDGDGYHDEHEIALHFQLHELKTVSDEVEELDLNGDGKIDISEWQEKYFKGASIHAYQLSLKTGDPRPTVNEINLEHHERTVAGKNDPVEFHARYWEHAKERASEVLAGVDKDGDGKISHGEHQSWHLEL
jgi:hypothetical protein